MFILPKLDCIYKVFRSHTPSTSLCSKVSISQPRAFLLSLASVYPGSCLQQRSSLTISHLSYRSFYRQHCNIPSHILPPAKHHGYPPIAGQSHQMARFVPPTPPMAPRHASRRSRQPHLSSGRDLQTARRGVPPSPSVCSLLGRHCFLVCVVFCLACLGSVALHAYGMLIHILVCSLVEGSC